MQFRKIHVEKGRTSDLCGRYFTRKCHVAEHQGNEPCKGNQAYNDAERAPFPRSRAEYDAGPDPDDGFYPKKGFREPTPPRILSRESESDQHAEGTYVHIDILFVSIISIIVIRQDIYFNFLSY